VRDDEIARERRIMLERFYRTFNARDMPGILETLDPGFEFESRFARAGGTTYRGHDGVRGWFADLDDAWEYIDVELGETREVDNDRTIALITLRGRGRTSGIELNERAAHELSWRGGKLARLVYVEREDPGLDLETDAGAPSARRL
jgi:ketosteroid isomerase-like protein